MTFSENNSSIIKITEKVKSPRKRGPSNPPAPRLPFCTGSRDMGS